MSAPWILHRLYSLDPSSLDFLHRLHSLIRHDEVECYLTSLQGSELARLVDFLDGALSIISADNVSQQCLHKLQAICTHHTTLPSSYIIFRGVVRVGRGPIVVGRIADVWEGTYRGKRVFIKSLKVLLNSYQTLKKSSFERIVVWKRLRHPNIVPFIGVTAKPLQVVSEWMPNGTLTEFIERNLGTNRISLLLDVAEGLDYLHVNHTTYGNLNGSSILVDHNGHARLTDFELGSIVRRTNSVTLENGYIAAWTAPEILEGADTITRESDVFAFGMVMIEIFTGKRPFSEFATPVITSKIVGGERPARPLEAHKRGLTDLVWDVMVRCWHQDPPQRPPMTEVVRLVRECYRTVDACRAEITDIPTKVLMDNVLPFCETKDMTSLGCTNKFFALIVTRVFWRQRLAANMFWRQKLVVDYNFAGLETARMSGWKLIYQRIRNSQVFVWGEKDGGKLGLLKSPKTTFSDVPFPVKLHLPGVCVVGLAMSETAFYTLSADGSVYVWGALQRYYPGSDSPGFSNPCTNAKIPLKLQLPVQMRTVSCDNLYAMMLDANSAVWIFLDWGRPFRLVSPLLNCSSPETTPIQIKCAWRLSVILMESGDVYLWEPFGWRYHEATVELDKKEFTRAIVPDGGTVIPCYTWEINVNPIKLPILPDLPDLPATGMPEEECRKETKLIKIAALSQVLFGLTNKGHVLKMDDLRISNPILVWNYLPNYSEIGKIREHPAFHTTTGNDGQERPPQVGPPPYTMLITHVSAHDKTFFAYSSSMVLKGNTTTTPLMLPIIIPELQNRSVVSIVCGDSHFGALTSSGKLLTWGQYSMGALGLGDPSELPARSPGGYMTEEQRVQAQDYGPPSNVTAPSEVRFDHGLAAKGGVERYCFAVAAFGRHTAALVFDLAEDEVLNSSTQTVCDQQTCCLM